MHFSLWNSVDKARKPPTTIGREQSPQHNAQASTPRGDQNPYKHERKAHKGGIPPICGRLELPVELWLEIFHHALKPRFALMGEALPHDIQFFYTALTHPSLIDNLEMQHYKQTRAKLRLVCRAWKLAVDRIDTQNPDSARKAWIQGFDIKKAIEYGPCMRFDTHLEKLSRLRDVHPTKKYQHAVKVVRLEIQYLDSQSCDNCPDMTYLLAKPWNLTALHVSFITCNANTTFPTEIVQVLPSLRTLGIASDGPFQLSGPFTLPFLTTLFITFMAPDYYPVTSKLGEWVFPSLHTLSVDAGKWPDGATHAFIYTRENFGLGAFLLKHRKTLQSIRMIPVLPISFHSEDGLQANPLHALELPVLETLATNFVKSVPWAYHNGRPRRLLLPRIKHAVHISTGLHSQETFPTRLVDSLKPLSTIETISIIEEPFASRGTSNTQNRWTRQDVQNLDMYCQKKGIRVYGDMGSEFCCVESAWRKSIWGAVVR